jgi:RNA polymerase sigma factor for flagellar operon FliA
MPEDGDIEPLQLAASEPFAPGTGYEAAYRTEFDETEVIQRYAPLVKRLAIYLRGRLPGTVQLDDLIQAGFIALLRLARRTVGLRDAEAALRRSIINAMVDEARREGWAPVRTVRFAKAAAAAMRTISQRTGRRGTDEEIAAELGLDLSQYHQALVEVTGVHLLNLDEFDEDSEQALQVGNTQEEVLHQTRLTAELTDAIAKLPERERLVLSLYYDHELNMEEVGEVLDVDKSTISRTHSRALLMLRNALTNRSASAGAPQPSRRA